MRDPVVAVDGQAYERAFIERHVVEGAPKPLSPKSREPLSATELYSCAAIRSLSFAWAETAAAAVLASFHVLMNGASAVDRMNAACELARLAKPTKEKATQTSFWCPRPPVLGERSA
jgi:hypothetical protein